MNNVFLINNAVIFDPDSRRLCPVKEYPERGVTLHGPVSGCLLQLLEHNEQVLTQRFLFAAVWEKQGAIVTTNALYQTIASIRKALRAAGLAENIILTIPKSGFKSIASLQRGPIEHFIPAEVTLFPAVLPEGSVKPVSDVSRQRISFINAKLAYCIAALLILISCFILYSQLRAPDFWFEKYLYIGNLNGCEVFSSWHDKDQSQIRYQKLMARYPLSCKKGDVAYLTFNQLQNRASVMMCNRRPDKDDADCNVVVYREADHENE